MPKAAEHRQGMKAYAGLDFIRAALCPLEFNASFRSEHPRFVDLRKDAALAALEVGEPLHYPRQFPYTTNGNRRTGTQIVTAAFGLAPNDCDLLLGLYTYLKRLPEPPADGRSYLTVDFLARQFKLSATSQSDYLRIRSRLFRLSYVKYTNTAFWNHEAESYDIVNFGFFNLASMSRFTESRAADPFRVGSHFPKVSSIWRHLAFDYDLYQSLAPAMRRFYLIANRDGWHQRDSSVFIADDFTVHQIGYDEKPELKRLRTQKLKKLLAHAEEIGMVRPFAPWNGYLETLTTGPRAGEMALPGVAVRCFSRSRMMLDRSRPVASRTTHSTRRCESFGMRIAKPCRRKYSTGSSRGSAEI